MVGFKDSGDRLVEPMVASLSRYKTYVDLDLIFDSRNDFLYRQKGQLKLDNTIVEEFMPWLVGRSDQLAGHDVALGRELFLPTAFRRRSSGYESPWWNDDPVERPRFRHHSPFVSQGSHQSDFSEFHEARTCLAYIAAEIKTNLDKTMFQEANATAYDLKLALPNSRYFLLCEWLDMTPISTVATSIDCVEESQTSFGKHTESLFYVPGRAAMRETFECQLLENPFPREAFSMIGRILSRGDENEDAVLRRGWSGGREYLSDARS